MKIKREVWPTLFVHRQRNRSSRSRLPGLLFPLAGSLLAGMLLNVSLAQPAGAVGIIIDGGYGLDTCQDPTVSQMQAFWTGTPYIYWATYIGGENMGCSQPNLNASWISQVDRQGWDLTFFYVGLQDPCWPHSGSKFDLTNFTLDQFYGALDAQSALAEAAALGVGNIVPIADDLEAYNYTSNNCIASAQNYIYGWDGYMSSHGGTSGVYGSTSGSFITYLAAIPTPPQYIFGADFDGNPNVTVMPPIPNGYWTNHQRHKQYLGGHYVTANGVTLFVDADSADGPGWH